MSVINTMLKDLESRGGKRDLSKEEILQGLSSGNAAAQRQVHANPYLVGLLSALAVCVVMTLVYLYSPYQLVAAQQVQPEVQPQPAAITSVAASSAVTGITEAAAVKMNAFADDIRVAQPKPTTVQATPGKPALSSTEDRIPPHKPLQVTVAAIKPDHAVPAVRQVATKASRPDAPQNVAIAVKPDAQRNTPVQSDTDEAAISKTRHEPSDSEKSVNAYATAMDLFSQGRTEESRLKLKLALGLDPSNSKASQLLAAIYLGDNRPELAKDIIEKVLQLRSADQDLLRMYVQVQVQLKNYAQAISIMEQRIRASTPEDIAYLAGLYQKNNDHLGAVRLYAQALKLVPSNSVWWMGQGISFEALGMNEEAMKSYRQSINSGRLNTQLAEYVLGRIAGIEKSTGTPVS